MACTLGRQDSKTLCKGKLLKRKILSDETIRLIRIRSGHKKSLENICAYHYSSLIASYESHQVSCCDPFKAHKSVKKKRNKTKSLKTITLEMREKGKTKGFKLIPGQKLCIACSFTFSSMFPSKKSKDKVSENVDCTEDPSSEPVQSLESPANIHPPARLVLQPLAPAPVLQPPSVLSSPSVVSSSFHSSTTARSDNTLKEDINYPETLETLNSWLKAAGFSKISKRKLKTTPNYVDSVLTNIQMLLFKCAGKEAHSVEDIEEVRRKANLYTEMINQLIDYYDKSSTPNSQMLALSVLPRSLSVSKVQEEGFTAASVRQIHRIKSVVAEKGILSIPDPKRGRKISEEKVKLVHGFFYEMNVSRELPGRKDVISVVENGMRTLKRKRLVLGTLSTLYEVFRKSYDFVNISLSKFASLRPKECVLAGSPGTHIVCVCTYHQNPYLMFKAAELHKIEELSTVTDCLKYFMCKSPSEACHLRSCENCPDGLDLQEIIELYFAQDVIETITYNVWKYNDRSEIEKIISASDEFIHEFLLQVEDLVCHAFIADQQADFYKKTLNHLEEGEVVVNADFAENYSFVIQDSSQGHYFNNKQSTVHPFMCYGKKNGLLVKIPFVIISDHLVHDTSAFSMFQVKLIDHLKAVYDNITKIYYFSDGSAAQYKNRKSVANTWFHEHDYGIYAEWHFFATSHGKCACDGLGGTVKRSAYLHSLRNTNPDLQITTPRELMAFCKSNVRGMEFSYVSAEEIKEHAEALEVRFKTASEIEGIKSSHAIIPSRTGFTVAIKAFSNSSTSVTRTISAREIQLVFADVRGFVIFGDLSSDSWKLAYVTDRFVESEDLEVSVLKRQSQEQQSYYEFGEDTTTINLHDVLLLVEPQVFKKGQRYKLLTKDVRAANQVFNSWKRRSH